MFMVSGLRRIKAGILNKDFCIESFWPFGMISKLADEGKNRDENQKR